ncbi:hypothetical protein [Pedobacter sp.]
MNKRIIRITLFLCVVCFILGIRTNWREYTFRKASTAAKATVISVDTELTGKAIAIVDYVLAYERDNVTDTISHFTTEAYYKTKPLPSIEELKNNVFYVHYVPKIKSNETPFKDRLFITDSNLLENDFYTGWFIRMIFVLMVGYLLSKGCFRNN